MNFGRLFLILIAVASFSAILPAQAVEECPVSVGSDMEFRSPWPKSSSWFGTEALATMLPADGIWPTTKPDALISVKLFWYSTEFQATADAGFNSPNHVGFNARIRRLDQGPNDAVISGPNWAGLGGLGDNWTILTGIDFQSAGCWEIIGEYLDQSLSFVVKTIDHNEWMSRY